MPKNSRDLTASGENNASGPDFFGFYTSEVKELLSQDDGLLPFPDQVSHSAGNHHLGREKGSGSTKNSCRTKENNAVTGLASLFSNGLGALLSESRKERLKSLLRQSVFSLTQEVDEMINPVLSICRLRSCLRCKESLLSSDAITCEADQPQHPHKKLKGLPACLDLESEHMHLTVLGKELSDDVKKKCIGCHAASSPQWRPAADGTKSLCNACGLRYAKNLRNGSLVDSDSRGGKDNAELDDDLRFILENDSAKVEEIMERHSSEISATLHHMELKLEELLNILMTTCRAMTLSEKQQLRRLIQKLPPRSLDRVAEIIGHNKPSDKYSSDEVHVDLDEMDNVTLWRLYFYVATIQATSSMKISSQPKL